MPGDQQFFRKQFARRHPDVCVRDKHIIFIFRALFLLLFGKLQITLAKSPVSVSNMNQQVPSLLLKRLQPFGEGIQLTS